MRVGGKLGISILTRRSRECARLQNELKQIRVVSLGRVRDDATCMAERTGLLRDIPLTFGRYGRGVLLSPMGHRWDVSRRPSDVVATLAGRSLRRGWLRRGLRNLFYT